MRQDDLRRNARLLLSVKLCERLGVLRMTHTGVADVREGSICHAQNQRSTIETVRKSEKIQKQLKGK